VVRVLARGIAALAVLAVLAAAGVAVAGQAAPKPYSAKFEDGGMISFQLERGNDKRVGNIYIDGMMGSCDDGESGLLRFAIDGTTPVLPDRSFAVRSKDGEGGKAIVRGKFSRRFKTAKGSARIYGKIHFTDGQTRRCDSGKQKYLAN
jgi:hypothetical protein